MISSSLIKLARQVTRFGTTNHKVEGCQKWPVKECFKIYKLAKFESRRFKGSIDITP